MQKNVNITGFKGWGDKMFFSREAKRFNPFQQKVVAKAKKFSKEKASELDARKLLNSAEHARLSHRGPEFHDIGRTAGQEHVHVLGKHIFLKG